jgi:protoporphyrinogen oxidase
MWATTGDVQMKPIAVLGTGMAGLGAGYALENASVPFTCYDKNPYFGGHTRSFRYDNGFVFDEGGHISFTNDNHVKHVLAENIRGNFQERTLTIDNYWHGYRIRHPVQCNMRGLPADLVIKIIQDFVSVQVREPERGQSYAHWLYQTYGKTFAETFPMVYGRKYHTTTMDRLTTDWIGPRMYRASLEELLRGVIEGGVNGAHYVGRFRYPSTGGFVSYLEPFSERFKIKLNHRLVSLDPRQKVLHFDNGSPVAYDQVISSIPLPDLIPLINGAPREVLDCAGKLAFTQAVLINIGVDRPDLSDAAITYFYDEDIIFSRVNLPHMFSEANAPLGCGTIQAEVYFSDKYRPFCGTPGALIGPVIQDLRRCGFIRDNDSIMLKEATVNRYANVIFDMDRPSAVATIHAFLDEIGVHYCGRYGNWDHAWTDEAFLSGEKAAQMALDALR